jgi:putative transposase
MLSIYAELRAAGVKCSRKRVAQLMRQEQLRACRARRYRKTTNSKHSHPVAANLLDRRFAVQESGAGNQSGQPCLGGRHHLHLHNRGMAVSGGVARLVFTPCDRMGHGQPLGRGEEELVQRALKMALTARQPPAGVVHHSDRGSQYAAREYQYRLEESGLVCSTWYAVPGMQYLVCSTWYAV